MLKYLNIDIKNALKNNLHDVDYLQKKVTQIHNDVLNKNVAEKDWLGWYDLPNNYNKEEFIKMYNKANEWKTRNWSCCCNWNWWLIFRS
nr:hypothetical protein [Mycoplasmopsis cynos]